MVGPKPCCALAEALTLGYPEGYVRVFADEGAPMRALLGRLAAAKRTEHESGRGIPLSYLARIRRAFDPKPDEPETATTAVPGLPGLTARERQVLGLLAQGRANRDIAAELVVTLDTVRGTSATFWPSSARSTGPRQSPGPGN